ncbi:MAG: TIGR03557 family F420-dependent LLM class oxidoreductase [Actinomycetota bacterium]
MPSFGYKLSSEEQDAPSLVRYARMAEEAGFEFAAISDHFHPWVDRQGNSPFVWGVLGAIAEGTERLRVGTAVTCPTLRIHPALVAQAAATAEQLMPGRFFLGLGSGENLNEHILGDRWPSAGERRDMLAEAVEVIRKLWGGGNVTHRGTHFRVEDARVYSLPEQPPPIYLAASGKRAARLAGEVADGMIGLAPDADLLTTYDHAGGVNKPKLAEINVCWARDEADAVKTTLEWWPNAMVTGELVAELPLPRHFEQAAQMVTEDDVREKLVMGSDPERHLEVIRTYLDAGFDHVWIHQIGPDQEGFFEFYSTEILPKLRA